MKVRLRKSYKLCEYNVHIITTHNKKNFIWLHLISLIKNESKIFINAGITPHLKKLVNSLVREVSLKVPPENKMTNINLRKKKKKTVIKTTKLVWIFLKWLVNGIRGYKHIGYKTQWAESLHIPSLFFDQLHQWIQLILLRVSLPVAEIMNISSKDCTNPFNMEHYKEDQLNSIK